MEKAAGDTRAKHRPEGIWRKSCKSFKEGVIYLLPWLLIPLLIGLIVALPQILEPLFGPSRPPCLVFFIRFSQIGFQPALLAGLLAALVGFGVETWKRSKEEERRQKERILGEVETVGRLLWEQRWDEALHTYEDFSQRRDLAWRDAEVQGRLWEIWQGEAPEELKNYSRCKEQYATQGTAVAGKVTAPVSRMGNWWEGLEIKRVVEALFWASQNLGRAEYDRATEMMVSLLSFQPAKELPQNFLDSPRSEKFLQPKYGFERAKSSQEAMAAEGTSQPDLPAEEPSPETLTEGTPQPDQAAPKPSQEDTPAEGASQADQSAEKPKKLSRNFLGRRRLKKFLRTKYGFEIVPTIPWVADRAAQALLDLGEKVKQEVKRWLWDSRFEKPIEKFRKQPDFDALYRLRAESRTRPSLWRGPRSAEREEVRKVLNAWRLTKNPFGPEWAEGDLELPNLAYSPPWWEGVKQPEPALIVGDTGSGKTAMALLLAREMNETSSQAFPVYASLSLTGPLTVETAGQKLSRLLGQALLEYLALDPEAFRAAGLPERAGMATLLMHSYGSKECLAAAFAQAGLSCGRGIGNALLGEISDLATACPEIPDLFALLGRARPAGREATVFLLDSPSDDKPEELAGRLQPLLDLAHPLARLGAYLKVFLPPDLACRVRWEGRNFRIEWGEKDLEEMLKTRLQRSGKASGSLQDEASQELREKVGDVDQWLVKRARGSPRELVRLGNWLLEAVGKHWKDPQKGPRIQPEALDLRGEA